MLAEVTGCLSKKYSILFSDESKVTSSQRSRTSSEASICSARCPSLERGDRFMSTSLRRCLHPPTLMITESMSQCHSLQSEILDVGMSVCPPAIGCRWWFDEQKWNSRVKYVESCLIPSVAVQVGLWILQSTASVSSGKHLESENPEVVFHSWNWSERNENFFAINLF